MSLFHATALLFAQELLPHQHVVLAYELAAAELVQDAGVLVQAAAVVGTELGGQKQEFELEKTRVLAKVSMHI